MLDSIDRSHCLHDWADFCFRQTLRSEAQAPRQELDVLKKSQLQLRKKMRKTVKSNNKGREQLQHLKASEEDLLAQKVSFQDPFPHLCAGHSSWVESPV